MWHEDVGLRLTQVLDGEISPRVYTADMFPDQLQRDTGVFTYWLFCIHPLRPGTSARTPIYEEHSTCFYVTRLFIGPW